MFRVLTSFCTGLERMSMATDFKRLWSQKNPHFSQKRREMGHPRVIYPCDASKR
jgi:hypothetical protein